MIFASAVTERTRRLNTRLCVGLDPRLNVYQNIEHLREHTLAVLEATAPYAACIKPQLAFFEALGLQGFAILEEVCALARTQGLPVILDAKRGDIGSTAEAYAQAWLMGAHAGHALTVNPFLGFQTLQPFVKVAREEGGTIFVLVKTSNPDQQDLQGEGISEKIAGEVARLSEQDLGEYSAVGAVVGATHEGDLAKMRDLMPQSLLLLPGLGAQGAKAADLAAAFHTDGTGALASTSRAVQYADGLDLSASVKAAQKFRDELNAGLAESAGKR